MNNKIKLLKEIACQRFAQSNTTGLSQAQKVRLKHELDIIEETNTEDCFISIIKQADIEHNQGDFYALGTANCSLLLYLAKATTINPLLTNSPFERYVNGCKNYKDTSLYYEISRTKFNTEFKTENEDANILLDDVIYSRAKKSELIDERLFSIAAKYPPAQNYQFVNEILAESKGVIIWQEQTMALLCRMGGFSYTAADVLRRDGGKGFWKSNEWYSLNRKMFISNAVNSGYDFSFADKYFRYIFESNMYTRLKAAVAAQVLFD